MRPIVFKNFGAAQLCLGLAALLSSCSAKSTDLVYPADIPPNLQETFEICLSAMDGIDSALELGVKSGWEVRDDNRKEDTAVRRHAVGASLYKKDLGQDRVGGSFRIIDFGRRVYPIGEKVFCNTMDMISPYDDVPDYGLERISEIAGVSGEAIVYNGCGSLRCEGRISGQWNVYQDGSLIWITGNLNESLYSLTFEKVISK